MSKSRKSIVRTVVAICCLILAAECMRAYRRNVQESLDWNLVLAIKLNDEAAVRRLLVQGANSRCNWRLLSVNGIFASMEESRLPLPPAEANNGRTALSAMLHGRSLPKYFREEHEPALIVALDPCLDMPSDGRIPPTRPGIISTLIDHGADVNTRTESTAWPKTALQVAIFYGEMPAVKLLLDRGANVNGQLGTDDTPLQVASRSHQPAIAQLLLDRGGDSRVRSDTGESLLEIAAGSYDVEGSQIFIKAGNDVNGVDKANRTPLMAAARCGSHEVVQLLIESGADPTRLDRTGKCALAYSIDYGNFSGLPRGDEEDFRRAAAILMRNSPAVLRQPAARKAIVAAVRACPDAKLRNMVESALRK